MSRILLAWELGGGAGHLSSLRPVAEALLARGHQVTLAVRDISSAAMVFNGMENEMRIMQAPVCPKTYSGLVDPPLNFAEILMRFGYLDTPMLKALLLGWRSLLKLTGADRLVVDHAPTALLAARGRGIACSTFGNPFSVPPPVSPTPNMRDWLEVPTRRLQDSDARVVSAINAALAPDAPPISSLPQMFEGAEHLFVGISELDPYGARASASYIGLHTGRSGSEPALWPQGEGPQVFAYLKADYPHIQICLEALAAAPVRCLVNLAGATPQMLERYRSPRLSFSAGHVDIDHALAQCDVLVCQSGLGTVSAALRGGKPLLLLPSQLEQFLLARNVEKLGVGLAVHPETKTPDIAGSLARLLADPLFAQQARALAQRCSVPSVATIVDQVVARIEAGSAATVA
jgi:UDP:flavonoid glycosyltransferase YjiC (YdhE family)